MKKNLLLWLMLCGSYALIVRHFYRKSRHECS